MAGGPGLRSLAAYYINLAVEPVVRSRKLDTGRSGNVSRLRRLFHRVAADAMGRRFWAANPGNSVQYGEIGRACFGRVSRTGECQIGKSFGHTPVVPKKLRDAHPGILDKEYATY